MKTIPQGKVSNSLPDINNLESFLGASLTPVRPRPEFIHTSKERLAHYSPTPAILPAWARYSMIFLVGAFSSAVIVVAGVRALLTLVGAYRMWRQVGRQVEQKKAASFPSASVG